MHVFCDGEQIDVDVCAADSVASLYDKIARRVRGEFYLVRDQLPTVLYADASSLAARGIKPGDHLQARRRADGEVEISLLDVDQGITSTFLPVSNEKGMYHNQLSGKPRYDCRDTMIAPTSVKQILLDR